MRTKQGQTRKRNGKVLAAYSSVVLLILLIFFSSEDCLGASTNDVQFKLIVEPIPDPAMYEFLNVSISLTNGPLFYLGYTSGPTHIEHGVDPKSIKVKVLPGNENLLHISWSTYHEGMAGYVTDFSIVALQNNSSKILLKRQFFVSGGGLDSWRSGRDSIIYNNSILKIFFQYLDNSSGTFDRKIQEFMLTEKYKVCNGTLELEETIQKYKILKGDNLKKICKIMEWKAEWVLNTKPLIAGKWLTAKIPYKVAVLRWPAIAKFED
jgi:hypothetical protein